MTRITNFEDMAKKRVNFRLDESLVADLQKLAVKENRTLTNYIETVLKKHIEENKKKKGGG
jgi:hypothetical protein